MKVVEYDGLRFVRDNKTGYYLNSKTQKGFIDTSGKSITEKSQKDMTFITLTTTKTIMI